MPINVLVVDDSAVMRAMVVRALRMSRLSLGHVHEAADGGEALAVLRQHRVDLALVDLNMPVMNGVEFLQRVRGNPATAELAVVVVSTEGSETRIEEVRRQGAEFVHKPFSPEQLRDVLRGVTGVGDDDADDAAL